MSILAGKRILLGVCGSIAAYKSAFLTRLLIKAGAEVQTLMTPAATAFISPLTLSVLSKRPVFTEVQSEQGWNNHVEMGLWADAFLIAPVTASTLAKLASGQADHLIAATYLSARCPVFFAPAMDLDMWAHPATRRNVHTLLGYGNQMIPVGHGELASGLTGEGRMAEPEEIVAFLEGHFAQSQPLDGLTALVTAGPTYEPIDPVRFIGNHASGKMGIAIAQALAVRGASVELVLGPTHLSADHPRIRTTRVQTAQEMYQACLDIFPAARISVLAAAVADFRPARVATEKIKKADAALSITLESTPDIAASLGRIKQPNQLIVGFALETENELENARGKLSRKNFDFIVLNSLKDPGAGFNHDTNKITIVHRDGRTDAFDLQSKTEAAVNIVQAILGILGL